MPSVPHKFNLRRTTDVSNFTSNWLDWKIQQEIMRSDMPKLCQRWKAWGYHECSKKCRAVSRLDEPYIHGKHIKSNLFDCYQPPCVLYWKDDPDLTIQTKLQYIVHPLHLNTKGNETSHYNFIPPIWQNLSFYTPCVYPLLEGDIIPQAILQQNWVRDRTGTLKYNNMNNFLNWRDPSDFVTSFALWSQM